MNFRLASFRRALGAGAALVIAAGCGGSQSQTNPVVPAQSGMKVAVTNGGSSDLLFAEHADGSVGIYSYPSGRLVRRLSDVRATALCANASGDVFVAAGSEVLEYARGAMRPAAVLRNAAVENVQSCAVDPQSGDLAVTGRDKDRLELAIYAGAKGSPKASVLKEAGSGVSSSTYDGDGDLFVENGARLLELPRGSTKFRSVSWSGPRSAGLGAIAWDGKYLAVMAPANRSGVTTIDRFSTNSQRLTPIDRLALKGFASAAQFWIGGGTAVVPAPAGLLLYDYPAGGGAKNVMKDVRDAVAATVSRASQSGVSVTTYHYDNQRTGWDPAEYTLSYQNVKTGSFGLQNTVTLDDQVDTQPLVVSAASKAGESSGAHDVVYVATESNTVYAIDAGTGSILFSRNLGNPVPAPLGCTNNGPNVGINGTPVIDLSANVMYVITYTMQSYTPTYTLHELSLADFSDVVSPVVVAGSHRLTDGTTYTFDASVQRQRPALLEANGNIYAGFGSFCDYSGSLSRGWLLGWQAGSLTPLAANRLNDRRAKQKDPFFLSSVWMSGFGVAADTSGSLYFATGNSDPSSYNGVTNIQESVVKVSSDLTKVQSIFTPSDVDELDRYDADFGSGGVLLLPSTTPYAVAAGKVGTMFLLKQSHLGGHHKNFNDDLAEEQIGGCWCGESYFDAAADTRGRVVASGGDTLSVWKVKHAPKASLTLDGVSTYLPSGQDPGFFTAVSSNGNKPGAIIWAVARPTYVPGPLTLLAFKSEPQGSGVLPTLYQASAGYWTASQGDANIVPVIANGRVYVATYQQLDIFGLGGSAPTKAAPMAARAIYRSTFKTPSEITGVLVEMKGTFLSLRTRTGKYVRVDDTDAVRHERSSDLIVGEPFNVRGSYDAAGLIHAALILRAKPSPASWPPDR